MANIEGDPFAQNVINAIPRDIQNTLTAEQIDAFAQALGVVRSQKRHKVDWRFLVRGPYRRYYVVILIGEDRRRSVRKVLATQREQANYRVRMIFGLTGLAVFILFALVGLAFSAYLLKSALGIDFFPDEHLGGVLRRILGLSS